MYQSAELCPEVILAWPVVTELILSHLLWMRQSDGLDDDRANGFTEPMRPNQP